MIWADEPSNDLENQWKHNFVRLYQYNSDPGNLLSIFIIKRYLFLKIDWQRNYVFLWCINKWQY